MNVSTLTVAPSPSGLGAAPAAEPWHAPWHDFQPATIRDEIALRAASTDMPAWYAHIAPAAACSHPVRLAGHKMVLEAHTDPVTVTGPGGTTTAEASRVLSTVDTSRMPDGVIYKACGNRRASVCPACAKTYQQDAYQLLRAGLVGGKGVPDTVAAHPAVFATLTAPSFGTVHTRVVGKHTCTKRSRCDCRPHPCRVRSGKNDARHCPHGRSAQCHARHDPGDPRLGKPLCLDCYHHHHHVVWNLYAGELWRRTKQAAERHLWQLARQRGIPDLIAANAAGDPVRRSPVRLAHGKAAEYQARAAIHFHALLRLDGVDPNDPLAVVPPPPGFGPDDITEALRFGAHQARFTTPAHPDRPDGWPICWGDQLDARPVNLTGADHITDQAVAGYLAKYATKSTEATGFAAARFTDATVKDYTPDGDHIARLIAACWHLGRPRAECRVIGSGRLAPVWRAARLTDPWTCPDCGRRTRLRLCPDCQPTRQEDLDTQRAQLARLADKDNPFARLRRWAHMLGFGGHTFTKARRYSVTFGTLRAARINHARLSKPEQPPPIIRTADHTDEETTLIIGGLTYAGIGWHTTGDALLANTSAALARARHQAARDALTDPHHAPVTEP